MEKLLVDDEQRTEMIEDRVNAEPVPFTALGIDLGGMPGELVKLLEDVYRATRRNALNEHAIELEQMEAEHAQYAAECNQILEKAHQENDDLRERLDECEQVGLERGQEIDRLKLELSDAISKRDAAVREKEENYTVMNAEIQSRQSIINELRAKLEEYEKAAEYQARQDQPISMTEEETNSLQASADAVKKLFTDFQDWGSRIQVFKEDGSYDLVKRTEFENEWAPVPPELSLDLPSFREEDTASNVEDNTIPTPEAPEAVKEGTFQSDVLAGHSDTDAAETGEATIEERVARLEAAVFGQAKAAA